MWQKISGRPEVPVTARIFIDLSTMSGYVNRAPGSSYHPSLDRLLIL